MVGVGGDRREHASGSRGQSQCRGTYQTPATDSESLRVGIPNSRSTGNLLATVPAESSDRARIRMSLDASIAGPESNFARSPIMTAGDGHEHGLGQSGLRRIRQSGSQPPRNGSLGPSNPASRSPSVSLSRSTSITMLHSLASGPSSPAIMTEDLDRFPSESLHSFSFAHQSAEFISNRQNVLKRSIQYMQDRIGRSVSAYPALASAQARLSGDYETQNMLDLLARANLTGGDGLTGPLTGPAYVSSDNVFDANFIQRTDSPEPLADSTPTGNLTSDAYDSQREANKDDALRTQPSSQSALAPSTIEGEGSADSSRTPTNESGTTQKTSPPESRRPSTMRRTFTDTVHASYQQKLMDAIAQPFSAAQSVCSQGSLLAPAASQFHGSSINNSANVGSSVHGHSSRWVPAAQAIFTTEAQPPWTILAANDLACLVFGVTKAEVRKMGILEVVQEERRAWLENKLKNGEFESHVGTESENESSQTQSVSDLLGSRGGGITAKLLSKPNSRAKQQPRKAPNPTPALTKITTAKRPETFHSGDARPPRMSSAHSNHKSNKSRGVLLCGDVVPIQKRNGATGSASLWVKEKRIGLIWVLEEIAEDIAYVTLDEEGIVTNLTGELGSIWGVDTLLPGMDVGKLIPRIPRQGIDPRYGPIDYNQIARRKYYTCRIADNINLPATVEHVRGKTELRVSSYPHIAGIIVVEPRSLTIKSSNSVFCGALFGHAKPDGMAVTALLPDFDKILRILTQEDGIHLVDGIVVPEHSFRKVSAFLGLREGRPDATDSFLRPEGLLARHRDGTELKVDVQMRVVKSEKQTMLREETLAETSDEESAVVEGDRFPVMQAEDLYALWITYSRHIHAIRADIGSASPVLSGAATPLRQPSPGQQTPVSTPAEIATSDSDEPKKEARPMSMFTKSIKEAALNAAAKLTGSSPPSKSLTEKLPDKQNDKPAKSEKASQHKKTIEDFAIVEEMGQGAYGQVKLARYKETGKKVVLKYVTKKRILVDTWTRDRKLGTVPLEIHVLNYLRREDLRHANIVEMEDFFEDSVNYYIEMVPHGLPGMDLFDYIELRTNMEEDECRSIFIQVASAIHHLHIKAKVVHRDIKDENVVLDGEGNVKLIDFGSAAYIKSGPFDVFVGTIDYAAPEVLAGKSYNGKEQDVWALGILLYTIIYKENPFYSIDEIMDRDLRVPYTISDDSIDLIRNMLNRDVAQRIDIAQVLEHPWCNIGGD